MMATEADRAMALLAEHSADLRRQIREARLVRTCPPTDRLEFIAGAIERYLSGAAPSLDHALGLKRGQGRPSSKSGTPGKHLKLVIEAMWRRAAGQSWNQICDEIRDDFDFFDGPADLRKIYNREKRSALEWYAEQIGPH